MTATPDPDSAEAARLRRAHELLDERPSPNVRSAVLRAAAGGAGSPRTTETARAPRPGAARRWFEWGPMAAAAGVTAVAILAVGVAVHVDRETSGEASSPAAAGSLPSPAVAVPPSSPGAGSTEPSSPAAASRPLPPAYDGLRAAPAAKSRNVAPAPPPTTSAPATAGSAAAAPSARSPARDQILEGKPQNQPADEVRPSMQAPPLGKVAPPAAQPMAPAAESRLSNAARSSRANAAKEAAEPLPQADEWLRRIIELRRAGRNAQADDELARFHAAFPNFAVPAEALK